MTIPEYSLRYSNKAKHLQLRFTQGHLEVIVPKKYSISQHVICQFIQEKQSWIKKYAILKERQEPLLPEAIDLKALKEIWRVSYLATDKPRLSLMTNLDKQITLMGNLLQQKNCLRLLRTWLLEKAQHYLPQELERLSKETGLTYHHLTIRTNLTRWGSCSSQGNISLCCKLLLLPAVLMRHVLLHELCHTEVMNHGKRFWQRLNYFDSEAKKHVEELKAVILPLWIQWK